MSVSVRVRPSAPFLYHESVAQLGEHYPDTVGVTRSSRVVLTTEETTPRRGVFFVLNIARIGKKIYHKKACYVIVY